MRGTVPETGEAYHATDPALLLWVHATLIDTALRVYDRYVAPLSAAEQQAYHAEARQVAIRLGVPSRGVPDTLVELRAEMARLMADGTVARQRHRPRLAPSVLYPSASRRALAWDAAHLISIPSCPTRSGAATASPGPPRASVGMRRVAAVSRRVVPLLPRHAAPRAAGRGGRTQGRRPEPLGDAATAPSVSCRRSARPAAGPPRRRPRPWRRLAGRRRTP